MQAVKQYEKRIVNMAWMQACLEEQHIVEPSEAHLVRPPSS